VAEVAGAAGCHDRDRRRIAVRRRAADALGRRIFKPGQGWEYCASIAVAAWTIGAIGPGEWSLDHAFDIEWTKWSGAIVAALVGVGGGALQLAISYRRPPA
jgi:hypothetical protein